MQMLSSKHVLMELGAPYRGAYFVGRLQKSTLLLSKSEHDPTSSPACLPLEEATALLALLLLLQQPIHDESACIKCKNTVRPVHLCS